MSASKLDPIRMFANTTQALSYLTVYGVCRKLEDEIRAFVHTHLKGMGWATVKVDDLGKGYESRTEPLQVEHQDAIEELESAKHFYQSLVDIYEGALALEILNALHVNCETINAGLVNKLQVQVRAWIDAAREQAGDNQWRLRVILTLMQGIETLGEYHAKGIAAQLDTMDTISVVSTIWMDLKTRRLFIGMPKENLEMVS